MNIIIMNIIIMYLFLQIILLFLHEEATQLIIEGPVSLSPRPTINCNNIVAMEFPNMIEQVLHTKISPPSKASKARWSYNLIINSQHNMWTYMYEWHRQRDWPKMISPLTSVAFHFQSTNNEHYHITSNWVIVIKPLGYLNTVTMVAACDSVVTQIKKYIFIALLYI